MNALRNDSHVNIKFIQTRFQLIYICTYEYNILHVSTKKKKICLNINGRCDIR